MNVNPKKPITYILSISLALILFSCAGSKMAIYNGIKMPVDEVAKLRYAEAEKLYQYKKYAAAKEQFQIIANDFKNTNYADNALWRMAQISEMQKQYDLVYVYLKTLIQTYPQSDLKYKANYKAGEYALKNADELLALSYFSTVPLHEADLSQRSVFMKTMESLAQKNAAFSTLVSWYILNFYDPNTTQNYRIKLQQQIIDTIAEITSITELNSIEVPNAVTFPKGYLAFQKGKVYLDQENNEQKSKRMFSSFIFNFPNHAYVPKAQSFLQSLGDSDTRVSTDIVYIGLLVPLTGPKAHIGQQITKGVILAQDIYQARYPNAPRIKLLIQDTKGEGQQSVIAFEKLMQNSSRPSLIIGPCYHDTTQAIEPLLEQYRIPVFSLSSSESINLNNPWLFRNSQTKSEQALGLAYLAKNILKLNRVAILYPDNSYGQEFMQLSQKYFNEYGVDVVRLESYKTDQSDLTDAVRKLIGILPYDARKREICSEREAEEKTKAWLMNPNTRRCYSKDNLPPIIKYEAIFVPDGAQRAKRVFPTLRYYNVSGVTVLGTNLWDSEDFVDSTIDKAAQGSIVLSAFYKDKRAPHVQAFVQNYYNKFKLEPGILSAQAYDTASIVFSTFFNDLPRSSSDLTRQLKKIQNFNGVTGTIHITENGDTRRKLTPLIIDGEGFKELY